jgi:sterol desaturase/sphingolipid hydroxylase (fatty acid hydroxylase superfamily)
MDELTPFGGTINTLAVLGVAVVFAYLLIELLLLRFWKRKLDLRVVRMTLLGIVSNGLAAPVLARLLGPFTVGIAALAGAEFSFFQLGTQWYGWVYGFVVYEFVYWLQHWLGHKVRLLWCIHSPHHAPGGIHMAIGANHHFLEGLVYFPFFFGFVTAVLGVDPMIAVALNIVDMVWGSYLHLSNEIVRDGRYGLLGRFMQTPAHHRVHHATNPRYMDRNFNSISLLWDWLLGTLEPLRDDEPVEYGITRQVDHGSYWDVHFGEFVSLIHDLRSARHPAHVVGYLFRPPGWRPGDISHTASAIRAKRLAEEAG